MIAYELTIHKENNRIFRGFFSPAFPHTKNIEEALFQDGSDQTKVLFGKLITWEKIKDGHWQQIIVIQKQKYKLVMIETVGGFYPTAPMFLESYNVKSKGNS